MLSLTLLKPPWRIGSFQQRSPSTPPKKLRQPRSHTPEKTRVLIKTVAGGGAAKGAKAGFKPFAFLGDTMGLGSSVFRLIELSAKDPTVEGRSHSLSIRFGAEPIGQDDNSHSLPPGQTRWFGRSNVEPDCAPFHKIFFERSALGLVEALGAFRQASRSSSILPTTWRRWSTECPCAFHERVPLGAPFLKASLLEEERPWTWRRAPYPRKASL